MRVCYRRPTFSETKRIIRTLLSIHAPSAATLAAFAPQVRQSKRSTAAAVTAAVPDLAAGEAMPEVAVQAEPQLEDMAAHQEARAAECSRLHTASSSGDAERVCRLQF